MIIGVPTEVKTREYRVGMIPAGVRTLVAHRHQVLIQAGAGTAQLVMENSVSQWWLFASSNRSGRTSGTSAIDQGQLCFSKSSKPP